MAIGHKHTSVEQSQNRKIGDWRNRTSIFIFYYSTIIVLYCPSLRSLVTFVVLPNSSKKKKTYALPNLWNEKENVINLPMTRMVTGFYTWKSAASGSIDPQTLCMVVGTLINDDFAPSLPVSNTHPVSNTITQSHPFFCWKQFKVQLSTLVTKNCSSEPLEMSAVVDKNGPCWARLKELRHPSCILKKKKKQKMAKLFKIVIFNPFQSSPSSTIFVPFCFGITPLVFFFISKLLILGFATL